MVKLAHFSHLHRILYGIGGAGLVTAAALWMGPIFSEETAAMTIALSTAPSLPPTSPAVDLIAQTPPAAINPQEIQQYASSVLRIESLRTIALRDIQPLVESSILSELSCHQRDTFRRLPNPAKDIFVTYCTQSIDVVEQTGLSIARFNEITATQSTNSAIANQVQQTLQQLQRDAGARPPSQASPVQPSLDTPSLQEPAN